MFNIRYIDPQVKERICNAVKKVDDDTKLFSNLHLDTLSKSNTYFVSLVAMNSISDAKLRA